MSCNSLLFRRGTPGTPGTLGTLMSRREGRREHSCPGENSLHLKLTPLFSQTHTDAQQQPNERRRQIFKSRFICSCRSEHEPAQGSKVKRSAAQWDDRAVTQVSPREDGHIASHAIIDGALLRRFLFTSHCFHSLLSSREENAPRPPAPRSAPSLCGVTAAGNDAR